MFRCVSRGVVGVDDQTGMPDNRGKTVAAVIRGDDDSVVRGNASGGGPYPLQAKVMASSLGEAREVGVVVVGSSAVSLEEFHDEQRRRA